jgi:hypothetical protein
MLRTVVEPPAEGKKRNQYSCPECGGKKLKKLSQAEVFLAGEWPAPSIEVRECKSCYTLSEFDRWLADRAIWRGVL